MSPLALGLLLAAAQQQSALQKAPPAPVDFGAVTMTLEPKDNRTFLDGDVWLQRFDLRVTGKKAVAEFSQDEPKRPHERSGKAPKKAADAKAAEHGLTSFTVDGAVHVERPSPATSRTADGDHAVYDGPAQTLLLTGAPAVAPPFLANLVGPVLREGKELMVGERMLLHLDTDEVEVTKPRLWLNRSLPGVDQEAGAAKASTPAPAPVRVEAGTLRLDQQRKVARFRDRVVVHRGDLTVRGPRMDARYDDKGELTTLELRGGVTMVEGDRRAVGKQADYDAKTRTLVLTGDPRLYDRGDVLRGDRIEMLLDTHEVKVDKAHGRLRPEQHKDEPSAIGKKP